MHDSEFEKSDKEEKYMPSHMDDPIKNWQGFTDIPTDHVDSDQYESDYICSESSEDENEPFGARIRSGRRRVEFNESVDMRDPNFVIGMIFPTHESLKRAIKEYSIVKYRNVRLVKNDKGQVRAKCQDGCLWTIFATLERDGLSLLAKILNDEQTCGLDFSSKKLSSWWLAKKYLGQWRANPS